MLFKVFFFFFFFALDAILLGGTAPFSILAILYPVTPETFL